MVFVGFLRCQLTMHDKRAAYRLYIYAVGKIVNHFLVISMSGKALYLAHLGFYLVVKTEDTDPFQIRVLDTRPQRGRRTIAHNENGGGRVGDMVCHMVFDTPCLQHTRCGNDNTRIRVVVQRLRLPNIRYVPQRVEAEWVVIKAQVVLYVFVQFPQIHTEYMRSVHRQR